MLAAKPVKAAVQKIKAVFRLVELAAAVVRYAE
jgi:hypothetical protein